MFLVVHCTKQDSKPSPETVQNIAAPTEHLGRSKLPTNKPVIRQHPKEVSFSIKPPKGKEPANTSSAIPNSAGLVRTLFPVNMGDVVHMFTQFIC